MNFDREPTREQTVGERLFDIFDMNELADEPVNYDGGMTAAEYVGERGHPDAVATFTDIVTTYDALIEAGYNPDDVPEFVKIRDAHKQAIAARLNAAYDEAKKRWVVGGIDARVSING